MTNAQFRPRLLAATAFTAVALASPTVGFAQDAGEGDDEQPAVVAGDGENQIVVTGFRRSLEDALNMKRNQSGITDSISSEDIGKSTDANIAEALQRVTGVAIGREAGEGTTLTIRGAGANLNNVTLNGVPVSSSGANQAVDFSQFSSDLLSSITVYKTSQADQNEGSLGGNVALRTFRPLSVRKDRIVLDFQGRYNEFADEDSFSGLDLFQDYRVNASVVKKLFDDTLGISIVATSETSTVRQDVFDATWFNTQNFVGVVDPNEQPVNGGGDVVGRQMRQVQYQYFNIGRDRDSVTGTLQWQPSDRTELIVSATYSKQNISNLQDVIAITPELSNQGQRLVFDPTTNTYIENIYTSQFSTNNASNTPGVIRLFQNGARFKRDNFILSGEFTQEIGDFEIKLSGGRSYSKQRDNNFFQGRAGVPGLENLAFDPFEVITNDADAANAEFFTRGFTCETQPSHLCSLVLSEGIADDGRYFELNQILRREQSFTDEIYSFYADIDWDVNFGPITKISFGGKYEDRRKDNRSGDIAFTSGDFEPPECSDPDAPDPLPELCTVSPFAAFPIQNYVIGTTPSDWGERLGYARDHLTDGWIRFDLERLFNDLTNESGFTPVRENSIRGTRMISQEVIGGYAMADFELFDARLFGNFGIRYAETEVVADGFSGLTFRAQNFLNNNNRNYFRNNTPGATNADAVLLRDAALGVNTLNADGLLVGLSDAAVLPTRQINKYDNWLPSVNANFFVTPRLLARAGWSKTIARPELDDLAPGFTVNEIVFGTESTARLGGTNLLPFKSTNIDLSLEWYFANNSLFSVAFFDKKLSDFAEESRTLGFWRDLRGVFYDANGALIPADQVDFDLTPQNVLLPFADGPLQGGCMPDRFGNLNNPRRDPPAGSLLGCDYLEIVEPRNGQGGYVRGLEVQFQHNFTWLPGFFSGFGVQANYTYSDSETDEETEFDADGNIVAFFPALPLVGTSKHTFNGTVFWEKDGKLVRLAYNYRTDYLINRAGNDGGAYWIEGFDTLDLSANWQINRHVALNFQAQNLLDTVTRTYNTIVLDSVLETEESAFSGGTKVRTQELSNTGRVYRFGIRFNF